VDAAERAGECELNQGIGFPVFEVQRRKPSQRRRRCCLVISDDSGARFGWKTTWLKRHASRMRNRARVSPRGIALTSNDARSTGPALLPTSPA